MAILDISKAISRKWSKIGDKLLLITNRKSSVSFRLLPKSVTLNDLERRNGRISPNSVASGLHCVNVVEDAVVKSSCSLSHLLMSFLFLYCWLFWDSDFGLEHSHWQFWSSSLTYLPNRSSNYSIFLAIVKINIDVILLLNKILIDNSIKLDKWRTKNYKLFVRNAWLNCRTSMGYVCTYNALCRLWTVCINHAPAAPATPAGVWTMHRPSWPHRP